MGIILAALAVELVMTLSIGPWAGPAKHWRAGEETRLTRRTRAARLHASCTRRGRAKDRRAARRDEMRADVLRPYFFGRLDVQAQCVAVKRKRLVDVLDGDADVVEGGAHELFSGCWRYGR